MSSRENFQIKLLQWNSHKDTLHVKGVQSKDQLFTFHREKSIHIQF